MKYNKLIRDNISDILISKGKKFKTHKATQDEYLEHLYLKVIEELMEFRNDPSEKEIGDIYEVLQAIEIYHNLNKDEIKAEQILKRNIRGGFYNGIILEEVEDE